MVGFGLGWPQVCLGWASWGLVKQDLGLLWALPPHPPPKQTSSVPSWGFDAQSLRPWWAWGLPASCHLNS